ncbi:SIR2 family protein [Vagococcus salmoninarum]|uniref:SIR2 family protein n=1 Tax=Vagococcus salmoninarum TaxID=2739 RepID=UPI00187E38EB|nr:SIR2 family protein [Vagococcus salmoninarum]MBE9389992.1 SIR2 family protein [Vagococcus salmoninarum]
MSLQDIVDNNSYPIVFIGSGISKRYLKEFPTWEELLESYWQQLDEKQNFYSFLRSKEKELGDSYSEIDKSFVANTQAASYIETRYNDFFFEGKITLEHLTIKTAYHKKISPFKFDLANKFSNYILNNDLKELEQYKLFLSKARVIVTTNYDTLTEDLLSEVSAVPKIYIGQHGFFDETIDWSELYKIHGDVSEPNSIVINEEDYESYDNNSILISAKILSTMVESPIIFLGYSLTDRNVRKLLNDFASQLPNEDVRKSANRIFVVEYKKDESEIIEEIIKDENLDFNYTLIRTDNYNEIYNIIGKIDEGLLPAEVRKYQSLIKEIVVEAGHNKSLDTVLLSPKDLDVLKDEISSGKPIVVALGDKKQVFVNPDLVTYLKDYLFEENNILPSVALRFVAKENPKARIPFWKYINISQLDQLDLHKKEKTKIRTRMSAQNNLDDLISKIKYARETGDLQLILENKTYSTSKKVEIITFNIKNIPKDDIVDYVKNVAFELFKEEFVKDKSNLISNLRRLFLAYDLLLNK